MTGPDGVLVVDKPPGPTSHDVVAVARRSLRTPRVGHTGTLDPLASGVLVLVLGKATRLARFMAHDTKRYEARVAFGAATASYDAEGEVTVATGRHPSPEDLSRELARRLGPQLQVPPAYSAKKVGGQVAHRAARAQAPLRLDPVAVTIHALTLLAYGDGIATIDVTASAGFYVRSLAHDLGVALGTGAHLARLRRTEAGPFRLDDAVGLDVLATAPGPAREAVLGLERLLPDLPGVTMTAAEADRVRHGLPLPAPATLAEDGTGPVRLLAPGGGLVAVADLRPGTRAVLQPVVVVG